MKVVLDSNILVSAFLAPEGEDAQVLRQAKEYTLYLSPFILAEVWQVLHYPRIQRKYQYPDTAVDRHIADLARASKLVDPKLHLKVCQDPNDNAVLACAVESEVDYLVTRNIKDFPDAYKAVTVIHPRKFLALLKM